MLVCSFIYFLSNLPQPRFGEGESSERRSWVLNLGDFCGALDSESQTATVEGTQRVAFILGVVRGL